MGGSWDATRLAQSAIAGLTNVGSDHPDWLGSKRSEIAGDKGQALAAADFAVLGPGVAGDVVSYEVEIRGGVDRLRRALRFTGLIEQTEPTDFSGFESTTTLEFFYSP